MNFHKDIFRITSKQQFEDKAFQIVAYQYDNVNVYQKFCNLLDKTPKSITSLEDIPFLPINFFKSQKILVNSATPEKIFYSSRTTGTIPSKHYIANLDLYKKSFLRTFTSVFGNIEEYVILGLLPSYLEREGSSLIYMVNELIKKTRSSYSKFYLNNHTELIDTLEFLENKKQKTILLGVPYALLDLIEKKRFNLEHTIIMETGGMKGKRKEMVKDQLHLVLKEGFGVQNIYSEYGMTELLSQAYSKGDGVFSCPPWMKVLTRDTNDALSYVTGKAGGINVIDLANSYSCSFIATQDLGKKIDANNFKILGRFDTADIRGCNLLIE